MERPVELHCAGKRVPMNRFTKTILVDVLMGLLKNLKGVDPEAELTLRVGPSAR